MMKWSEDILDKVAGQTRPVVHHYRIDKEIYDNAIFLKQKNVPV